MFVADAKKPVGGNILGACVGPSCRESELALRARCCRLRSHGDLAPATRSPPLCPRGAGHYVHTRVYLRKGKGNQRIAKVYAGPLPENEATFAISEAGIVDADA